MLLVRLLPLPDGRRLVDPHPHPPCRSERWATTSTPTQSSTLYGSPPCITFCPSIGPLTDATQRYFAREYPSYFWSIVIGVVGKSTIQSNPRLTPSARWCRIIPIHTRMAGIGQYPRQPSTLKLPTYSPRSLPV
jgi:hypothetical protein